MENFATDAMPYINFILTSIVGVILLVVIRQKNQLIKNLITQSKTAKDLLEMYDIDQLKKYTNIAVSNVREEYKKKISEIENKKDAVKFSKDLLDVYNELINFEVHNLLNISDEKQKSILNSLPKNKRILEKSVKSMKETIQQKIV